MPPIPFLNGYTRYLLKHLLGPTIFITLSLTGILWLAQSLRFIDLIINRGLSIGTFLYLTLLLMPSLLGVVMPVAVFCSVLYVYHRLRADSELIVLECAGLSKLQLARPAIILGLVVSGIGYLNALYFLPISYREFKDLQFFIRNNYASLLLQEGVFNTPVDGITVYLRERENNGTLSGILVHDNRDPKHSITMMAQQGQLVQTTSGPRFILEEGNRQEIDRSHGQLSLLHFDRYTLDISLYTGQETFRWPEPQERFLPGLFRPKDTPDEPRRQRLAAEGHQRLTWPLYALALALAGLSTLLCGSFNRRGQWRRLLMASILAAVLVTCGISIISFVAKYPLLTPLPYIILIVTIGSSLWALNDNAAPRKWSFKSMKAAAGA